MHNNDAIRPTKKQQEALLFIKQFIEEHGYSPSYREIMRGCHYTSVATVALHVRSLIARGHLVKRGRSARSLELTDADIPITTDLQNEVNESQTKWLMEVIAGRFNDLDKQKNVSQKEIDELYVLVAALKVLGMNDAATSFMPRLTALNSKLA